MGLLIVLQTPFSLRRFTLLELERMFQVKVIYFIMHQKIPKLLFQRSLKLFFNLKKPSSIEILKVALSNMYVNYTNI